MKIITLSAIKIYLNKALKILLLTNGLILIAGAMFGPIYALFVSKIGGDLLDASYAYATFSFVAGITAMLSGKFADKVKEKELVVVAGYLLMATGFIGYIFVETMVHLLIVQVIIGLGEAIYSPAFDAVYSDHISKTRSGLQWSFWEAMNYFTLTTGALAGGLLTTFFGFNMMFALMAALCVISSLYIIVLPRRVL